MKKFIINLILVGTITGIIPSILCGLLFTILGI